jgi:SAM-dependent methyltransferase
MSERLSISDQRVNAAAYDSLRFRGFPDGWPKYIQQSNFEILAMIEDETGTPLAGASCLDVGCGTGEMAGFLKERGIGDYLGIDVLSPSIEAARSKYPRTPFRQGDILVEPQGETFDFVFCSGAITAKLPCGNYEYLERMLSRMWELANVGVAFNYLANDEVQSDDLAFLFSRAKVKDTVKKLNLPAKTCVITYKVGTTIQDAVFLCR